MAIEQISSGIMDMIPFVFITMLLYQIIHDNTRISLKFNHQSPHANIALSSFLGGFPGCAGIMIILKQYASGQLPPACLIAALTATMGDAAFVLLSLEPATYCLIIATNILAGILVGILVSHRHRLATQPSRYCQELSDECCHKHFSKAYCLYWYTSMSLATTLALAEYFNQAASPFWFNLIAWLTIVAILWPTAMNALNRNNHSHGQQSQVIASCNFLLKWILFGYVLLAFFHGAIVSNIHQLLDKQLMWLPLVTGIIGTIPSCGPQIIVASLYSEHLIPLAAQLSNSISTNGDAFFPIFAVAPQAAILSTIYGFIIACLIGYACFLFV
ncbi:MAG: hypothetical protein CMF46_02485 [Legionellales bacterium]|nr:hypothetical protein [Legionellales bacterium]|tara:strand:+ start:2587 stop:3576 length:990 start_codon:yes stop_codon:yes gene_type:complete